MKAALPLLDVASVFRRASLSLSSLARKLCASGCGSEVHLLVGKLSKQLGNSCQTRSREEHEEVFLNKYLVAIHELTYFFLQIVHALKSLSNIGEALSGDHLNTVKNCFQERDNPVEIRVSALKAFRFGNPI